MPDFIAAYLRRYYDPGTPLSESEPPALALAQPESESDSKVSLPLASIIACLHDGHALLATTFAITTSICRAIFGVIYACFNLTLTSLGLVSYRLWGLLVVLLCCIVMLSGAIFVGQAIEASHRPAVTIMLRALGWTGIGYQMGGFTRWTRSSVCPVLPLQGSFLGVDLGICVVRVEEGKTAKEEWKETALLSRDGDRNEAVFDSLFRSNEQWVKIIEKEAEVARTIKTLKHIHGQWTYTQRTLSIRTGLFPPEPLSDPDSEDPPTETFTSQTYAGLLTVLASLTRAQATEIDSFCRVPDLLVLMLAKIRFTLSTTSHRIEDLPAPGAARNVAGRALRRDYIMHLDSIIDVLRSLLKHFDIIIRAHDEATAAMTELAIQAHRHALACVVEAARDGGGGGRSWFWGPQQQQQQQCAKPVQLTLRSINDIDRLDIRVLVDIRNHGVEFLNHFLTFRAHILDGVLREDETGGKKWTEVLWASKEEDVNDAR
ncbi:hypothetical protein LZ554_009583 [Drepanopeziza brunnea f. sp. 'monogermtubi']|nr:hypothetical protein LZ554_009583 [Drepanopeziza brunnea f. sp. 'monogermtubi']